MSIIDDAGEAAAALDDAGEAPDALEDAADQELVLRSRSGDRAAFAELWRRHYRAGISVARSMTSSLDADDLVQEAYARIYQSILRGGGPTGSFRAYLFTSIRNTAAGWGRARKETTTDDLETIEDPATSDRATEDALDRSITVRAFRSLPSRWQEALWYSEIEGMKPAEVAPLLGMKPTAVAQLTFRAREGLREAWIQAHLKDVANGSDCQWTIERLGAFARSNLSRRDQGRAEAHLADCTRCSIVASEAKDVSRRLTLVLLPLTIGVTGTAAYLATVQGGGSSLAALAAMPSGVVHGTIAAHGGTGLAVAGTGLGATGSGVATAGAAGTAVAAGTVAAATAGTAVTVAATGGGLLSAIGGMIGIVVAGAVLVGSAASGIALPPANAIAPAPTEASADLVTADIDPGETDAAAPSAADGSGSSDPAGPDPASAADTTEATSADDDARTGPNAARANPASGATGAANGAVKGSLTPDPGATGIANANGSTNGTGPGTANGKANGSSNGTGPGAANGTAKAGGAAAGGAAAGGNANGSTDGTGIGSANGTGPGTANGSANGTGTANGTGIATGSANGTGPGTANGNAYSSANGAGNGPGAATLPTGAPTFSATTSTADDGGLTIGLAIAGAPGATIEVLLNGSVKDRVILYASGAGSSTLHLTRGLVTGDAHLQLRYAAGNLTGPAVEVPVSELPPAAG